MHNPILGFIFQLAKPLLVQKLQTALRDHVFTRWNRLIQQFIDNSEDPQTGAVMLGDSGYFISLNVMEKPVFNRAYDYVEAQFNGLTYQQEDKSTIATNSLGHAYRNSNGRDEQLNLSDNALQSITPYILKQTPSFVRLYDQEEKFKHFFQNLIPSLLDRFGMKALYGLNIPFSIPKPDYVISKGVFQMKRIAIQLDLLVSNQTISDFIAASFCFEMSLSLTGTMANFVADSQFNIEYIDKDSFSVTSYIGDLDVAQDVLATRIQYLMEYLMEKLTYETNQYDFKRLVPTRFEGILKYIEDMVVTLDKNEHFAHIGFNAS